MKNNKKIKLGGLQVKSFVTSLELSKSMLFGGIGFKNAFNNSETFDQYCNSEMHTCYTHLLTEDCTLPGCTK